MSVTRGDAVLIIAFSSPTYMSALPGQQKISIKMTFKAGFNIVLYGEEPTTGGSWKERWGVAYTIGTTNQYKYYFLCKNVDILHTENPISMDT